MDRVAERYTTQLIEGNGIFNADGLDKFIEQVKPRECGLSYAIVSVMGPQSSGKSTLLNHLFHTTFAQMNADMGRTQTTKGILIARCMDIEPCTIVMDLEGTDGQEREDDTTFEKQSALFAIAVSHVVIINMWCHDIGREEAANKPLLRIVFGQILRLYSPRKTTLLFVIRDKTKTPLEMLERDLRNDIQKIWDYIPKPENKDIPLSKFFNVEVVGLPNYEKKEEEFKVEVARLRERFSQSIDATGLAGDRQGVVPASGLSISMKSIWQSIKENKDLNLPKLAIMVANVRCEEIASEKYSSFVSNKDWLELREVVRCHLVPEFGNRLSLLLDNSLSSYDEEVLYYDGNVASAKRQQLLQKLMHFVKPAYKLMFQHIQSKALLNFKIAFNNALREGQGFAVAARDCTEQSLSQFDELCNDATTTHGIWDYIKIRDNFSHDLSSHIADVRAAKLYELTTLCELKIEAALCSDVQNLLKHGTDDTWVAIRRFFNGETKTAVSNISLALSSFEMDVNEKEEIISKLKNHARRLVEGNAKYEAGIVLSRMKEKFMFVFLHNDDSTLRTSWTGDENITTIAKNARTKCLKLLCVLAAIRLDEDEPDTIWDTLVLLLVEQSTISSTSNDPLTSTTWEKVSPSNTLLTPVQCKSLWIKFKSETEFMLNYGTASQDAARKIQGQKPGFLSFFRNFGNGIAEGVNDMVGGPPNVRTDYHRVPLSG